MSYTVQVLDETTARPVPTPALTLDFETETVTVRELIRRRVYEECTEYNAGQRIAFRGLVTPEGAEVTLNGKRERVFTLNWEKQYAKAVEAFERNGLIVLVGDQQAEDLEQTVTLRLGQALDVTFLKLVPLVGG
ncbi:hypothetical protein ACFP81_14025 [Deinococcus lacus]|uniref:Uncharacterized protein n=1 Tax=Deinococcus lacus TaxID=392561 RepID=A0ABW1YFA0_9DEIO